jgi:hypothetical protein
MRVIEEISLSALNATETYLLKGTVLTGIDDHGKTIELCAGIEHVKIGDPESGFPCECGSVYCHLMPLRISNLKGDVLLTEIDEDEERIGIDEPKFFHLYAMPAFLIRGKHWNQLAAQFPNLRPVHELAVVRRRDLICAWESEIEEGRLEGIIENITIGNTWEIPEIQEAIHSVLRWGEEKPDEAVDLHDASELEVEIEQIWRGIYRVLCWEGFARGNNGAFHLALKNLVPLPFLCLPPKR